MHKRYVNLLEKIYNTKNNKLVDIKPTMNNINTIDNKSGSSNNRVIPVPSSDTTGVTTAIVNY